MSDWESRLVPDSWERFVECPDCEVQVHGPQKVGSPGGANVTLCEEHRGATPDV